MAMRSFTCPKQFARSWLRKTREEVAGIRLLLLVNFEPFCDLLLMSVIMWMIIHTNMNRFAMKTIQMTIDELLLAQVDQTVQQLNTTRSAFIREALEKALAHFRLRQMEDEDAAGYRRIPAQALDVAEWETEQAWGDEWNAEK